MSRLTRLLERVESVLSLVEPLLRELTGAPPESEVFDRWRAFRWDARRPPGRLVEVAHPAVVDLDDLLGVDRSLERLVRNTEQFLHGLPANNVLLYGERGTGKSSSVKGLLARYGDRGLRLVEVHRDDLADLPRVLTALRPASTELRFLLFCDDLSFDAGDAGYRELKAALEGGVEAPPDNVRIVATSNRRHLLPQTMAENREARLDENNELHMGEALEEKLALSDRFGLVLSFYGFDQPTYLAIVARYLANAGFPDALEGARADALRWALDHSSRSGRTARQFVTDWVGRRRLAALSR